MLRHTSWSARKNTHRQIWDFPTTKLKKAYKCVVFDRFSWQQRDETASNWPVWSLQLLFLYPPGTGFCFHILFCNRLAFIAEQKRRERERERALHSQISQINRICYCIMWAVCVLIIMIIEIALILHSVRSISTGCVSKTALFVLFAKTFLFVAFMNHLRLAVFNRATHNCTQPHIRTHANYNNILCVNNIGSCHSFRFGWYTFVQWNGTMTPNHDFVTIDTVAHINDVLFVLVTCLSSASYV